MAASLARKMRVQATVDNKFNRTYTGVYQVIADLSDSPLTVLQAVGIPQWGSSFVWDTDFDLWAFAQGYTADPVERVIYAGRDCWVWEVKVTWSSVSTERSKADPRNSPIDDPPVVSGSFLGERVKAIRDKDGDPIVNAAAEPYLDSPPTIMSNIDTLRISYNTLTINLGQRTRYVGTVNSSGIWGLEKRQALMSRWDWRVLYAGDLAYIAHDFEFHIKYDLTPADNVCVGPTEVEGWYTILPNRGYSPYKVPEEYESKVLARDKEDNPLTTPVSLNCDGTENMDPDFEYWNVFEVEREEDFTSIPGMPNPLPGPFV